MSRVLFGTCIIGIPNIRMDCIMSHAQSSDMPVFTAFQAFISVPDEFSKIKLK